MSWSNIARYSLEAPLFGLYRSVRGLLAEPLPQHLRKGLDRLGFVRSSRSDADSMAVGDAGREEQQDRLRVDRAVAPIEVLDRDPRTEPAGRPREQGRRASVKPARIGDDDLDRLHACAAYRSVCRFDIRLLTLPVLS